MAANEKKSLGIMGWVDSRFPVTDLLERHYFAKDNILIIGSDGVA
jgi:hypothetical protein